MPRCGKRLAKNGISIGIASKEFFGVPEMDGGSYDDADKNAQNKNAQKKSSILTSVATCQYEYGRQGGYGAECKCGSAVLPFQKNCATKNYQDQYCNECVHLSFMT